MILSLSLFLRARMWQDILLINSFLHTYLLLKIKIFENNRYSIKFSQRKTTFLICEQKREIARLFPSYSLYVYLSLSVSSFFSFFLSLFSCPCNAPETFGERYTTIVILPLSKILSKIMVDRGFTSPSENGGKEMTGWGNRMTSSWTFYLYLVYLRRDSFTASRPCECLFWSNDARYAVYKNMAEVYFCDVRFHALQWPFVYINSAFLLLIFFFSYENLARATNY